MSCNRAAGTRFWRFAVVACCGLSIVWLIVALCLQSNIGCVDNGDFDRVSFSFSSGPAGIPPALPGSEARRARWDQGYGSHWYPRWRLDFPRGSGLLGPNFNSSIVLLWLPGVLINYVFYSDSVLHLVWLSMLPRIVLLLVLLLVFRWIRADATSTPFQRLLLCLVVGVLYVLMVTTSDYVGFLNSFYYETGSLVYLLVFLASFVLQAAPKAGRSQRSLNWCVVALLLLAGAKMSNLYWPFLALPFVMHRFIASRFRWRLVAEYLVAATAMTASAFLCVHPPQHVVRGNAYDRLFCGALVFSENPAQRLAELGVADHVDCVGRSAWTQDGDQFIQDHGNVLTVDAAMGVLWKEPMIPVRMIKFAAGETQMLSAGYLEQRAADDPLLPASRYLNLWSQIKARWFPRGDAFFAALLAYVGLSLANYRRSGVRGGLAAVGLLASIACFVDMSVAIAGDGWVDLPKHLFLANVLFDVATIVSVGSMVAYGLPLAKQMTGALSFLVGRREATA